MINPKIELSPLDWYRYEHSFASHVNPNDMLLSNFFNNFTLSVFRLADWKIPCQSMVY